MAANVKLQFVPSVITLSLLLSMLVGCAWVPKTSQRDRLHNPFPQLKQVAILPFFNQSSEPTLDTDIVTQQYYAALQAIPGFEVMPVGVSKTLYTQFVTQYGEPQAGADFQYLAQLMGVEALVVGSVTDFDAYYPPRLAMTVNWFAANEGFHPIPAGYGLPWGTEQEKQIPKRIVDDAEFELARSQLATQTPIPSENALVNAGEAGNLTPVGYASETDRGGSVEAVVGDLPAIDEFHSDEWTGEVLGAPLPPDWPTPTDLIPDPPSPNRPIAEISHDPVLTHTEIYRGDDPYFTNRLANHIETGDDARPGGWQGYLRRSNDFIRFCCHLHITEMLESRGGSDQRDLILRWPLSRY
ncbi:MAG: hypothetical protein GY904_04185 [Planctomycetaceae bacterium]|nr:hypothetical protein [Planctomycetaceae bacterium]